MLQADLEAYIASISDQSREELIQTAAGLYRERCRAEDSLKEIQRATDEMGRQYRALEKEASELRSRVKALQLQNQHLTEVRTLQTDDLFGRSTEKASELVSGPEDTDPLDEDAVFSEASAGKDSSGAPKPADSKEKKDDLSAGKGKKHHKTHTRPDLSKLPHQKVFDYCVEDLNAEYGEGNWRFVYWNCSETLEVIHQTTYVKDVYRPVVSVGLEHQLIALPNTTSLLPKSLASPSLVAEIYMDRYLMFTTLYRQENRSDRFGAALSRQTMSNWCVRFAEELFEPVLRQLAMILKQCPYQQCDETWWIVVRDERGAGRKSYIWTHRTSELMDTHQIILYCFDLSRSAEHLLDFYEGLETVIHLTCDAYSGYETLESVYAPLIILCACMMHARRRFVEAFKTVQVKDLSEEKLKNLPEMKALSLIQEIYHADEALKRLDIRNRLERRITEVKPKVDAFFEYIRSLDPSSPEISSKLKDALQYSLNHEQALCRFLEDGNVPIDNGAAERSIRPLTILRKNSLFSCTARGAKASMTVFSLIETAKANGADPYYYIRYLLEVMPSHVYSGKPIEFETVFPWSPQYLEYEKQSKTDAARPQAPPGNEKPHTPRKKKAAEEPDAA